MTLIRAKLWSPVRSSEKRERTCTKVTNESGRSKSQVELSYSKSDLGTDARPGSGLPDENLQVLELVFESVRRLLDQQTLSRVRP